MFLKNFFIFLFLIFFSVNTFCLINIYSPENTIFVSKNTFEQISFDVLFSETPHKAVYFLKILSTPSKDLELSLSKQEDFFVSGNSSSFFLNIRSLDFTNETINLRLLVTAYDVLDNVVDDSSFYLKLISNNSEYDFPTTPNKSVPYSNGYSVSREKMLLINSSNDSDTIFFKNHTTSFLEYGLSCFFEDDSFLDLDIDYKGENIYAIKVSMKQDVFDFNPTNTLFCKSFNKNDVVYLRPITINILENKNNMQENFYLDQENTLPTQQENKEATQTNFFKKFWNKYFK